MALRPPVTDFPTADAWAVVQSALAGNVTKNLGHTLHVLNDVTSFAENQFAPDTGVTLPGVTAPDAAAMKCSDAEARAHIDALAKGTVQADRAGALPWAGILSLVIQAILAILNRPKA
jgi:hypothetical protein